MGKDKNELGIGTVSTFSSYIIWGLLTIYWKQIGPINAMEILSHRIIWGFVVTLIAFKLVQKGSFSILLKDRKTNILMVLSGFLVGLNWGIFIYAVSSGRILEASLGYYINPLVSVLLAMIFLKEKLTKLQITSLVLAVIGVSWMTISYGSFPWLSLSLALSFGFYGLLKKKAGVDSISSLVVETAVVLPLALAFLTYNMIKGEMGFLHVSLKTDILLIGSGFMTILPLFFYGYGTKRIPYSTVGFLQYIAPTLMLLIGILIYGETLDSGLLGCFIFIWISLILFVVSIFINNRKTKTLV